jgi:hypothetical protein
MQRGQPLIVSIGSLCLREQSSHARACTRCSDQQHPQSDAFNLNLAGGRTCLTWQAHKPVRHVVRQQLLTAAMDQGMRCAALMIAGALGLGSCCSLVCHPAPALPPTDAQLTTSCNSPKYVLWSPCAWLLADNRLHASTTLAYYLHHSELAKCQKKNIA